LRVFPVNRGERRRLYLGASVVVLMTMAIVFQRASLDGWQGVFLPALSERSETVYAQGYSYFGFRRIRVGMTEEEVQALIGKPLKVATTAIGGVVWVYSDIPVSRSYRMREVFFGPDRRVTEVVAEFVFD